MSATIAATLAARRADLERAVDALTVETKSPAPTAEDPSRAAVIPPLLVGIEQAQLSGGRRVRSPMAGGGRSPGWITATSLLVDIDTEVGPAVGSRSGWSRLRRLRAWGARAGSSPSLDQVDHAATVAGGWVAAGHALFSAPRWLPLRGAVCLDCGHDRVVDEDGTVMAALLADTTVGSVSCAVDGCGAVWPAETLHVLAAAMGVQTAAGVLALG